MKNKSLLNLVFILLALGLASCGSKDNRTGNNGNVITNQGNLDGGSFSSKYQVVVSQPNNLCRGGLPRRFIGFQFEYDYGQIRLIGQSLNTNFDNTNNLKGIYMGAAVLSSYNYIDERAIVIYREYSSSIKEVIISTCDEINSSQVQITGLFFSQFNNQIVTSAEGSCNVNRVSRMELNIETNIGPMHLYVSPINHAAPIPGVCDLSNDQERANGYF
jgi:hypothetical protein